MRGQALQNEVICTCIVYSWLDNYYFVGIATTYNPVYIVIALIQHKFSN